LSAGSRELVDRLLDINAKPLRTRERNPMKRVLLTIALAAAGCSSQEQSNARGAERAAVTRDAEASASRPPAKAESGGSESSTAAPKKEQRGNTPPGTSRAGEAPAAGAIADPSGATKR
ncbi:MAG: hypothetical protein ACXWCH_33375, partial [Burkholderiales bacterium]